MSTPLEKSYAYCCRVARERAKNFYYSFLLLEKSQREAMCALYTFNRVCDDISDEPERYGYASPRTAIEEWRRQLEKALRGDFGEHPCWPAFHDAVAKFGIPDKYFYAMLDGVNSDLERSSIETFDELYSYCYQVASAVGLSVLPVFGYDSPAAPLLAEKCGIAFQLTNILRDVREDAELGRVYLPVEDLRRFGVDADVLKNGAPTTGFLNLMRFEADRAKDFYRESAPLVGMVNKRSRRALSALIRVYSRLLERIEASGFDVLSQRIRVPAREKCWILLSEMCRPSH